MATLPLQAEEPPPVPYFSLQLATLSDEANAREAVAEAISAGEPFARAEVHGEMYAVRIGAWISRAEAQQAFESYRGRGIESAVIQVSEDRPWLFADGEPAATTAAAPTGPPAEPVADPAKETAAAGAVTLPPAKLPAPAPNPGIWWRSATATLASVGFEEGFFLEGTEGTREIFLPLPPGLEPRRAEIVLDLKFGESLIAESSYKISMNDTPRRTIRRSEVGGGNLMQVNLPLTERDLRADFVKLKFEYTQLLDRDICFSRELAGAYTRIAPGSGLMVLNGDPLPATVRAAWSLLPEDVVISADFSQITPQDYQALFQLVTLLDDDRRKVTFEHLPADAVLKDVHGHIVLGTADQLKTWGVSLGNERLPNANLRLVSVMTPEKRVEDRERRVFIFADRAKPLQAMHMLRMPWRRATAARLLDVEKAVEWPPIPDNPEIVRLKDLNFTDSERRFSYATDWKIGLPFGPMGNGNRADRVQLIVYAPAIIRPEERAPTVLSAYYNDRLVYSGALHGKSESQVVAFDLPRHMLRARNRLQLVAQRDEIADRCSRVQAAQPISISPSSPVTIKPINETPVTFAELVPHQRSLKIYVGGHALRAAPTTIPALVSLGHHFWPDVPPPPVEFFETGAAIKPASHYFVIGAPKWDPDAPVKFDKGRIRLVSNATQQEAVALDVASDADWSLMQMTRIGDQAGAWLRAGSNSYENLPGRRLLLEDENVALLDQRGLQMGLRVGAARDYEVQYPEAANWFSASDRVRTLLFVLLWVLGAALVIYLLRQSRRHRAG